MRAGNLHDTRAAEQWITKSDPLQIDPDVVAASNAWLEWVYPTTIVGQLPQAARVPFSTTSFAMTAAALAQWVGEKQAKPVAELELANFSLPPRKVASLCVIADELVGRGDAMTEERLGAALAGGVRQTLDQTFASADAEVPGVSPAGVFHGSPTYASAGTSTANMMTDLKTLITSITDGGISLAGATWLMRPEAAVAISLAGLATNATLGTNGGILFGLQAIVSSAVAAHTIGLVATPYIALALGDVTSMSASRAATLDMSGGNSPTYSLFQKNSLGLRCEIWANWSLAGGSADTSGQRAAALITGATWA